MFAGFEWDPKKAVTNLAKHGVAFEDAARVFLDPLALLEEDGIDDGEQRWQVLGLAGRGVMLVVVHVVRERDGAERIRIISARRAEGYERRRYEEGNGPVQH